MRKETAREKDLFRQYERLWRQGFSHEKRLRCVQNEPGSQMENDLGLRALLTEMRSCPLTTAMMDDWIIERRARKTSRLKMSSPASEAM